MTSCNDPSREGTGRHPGAEPRTFADEVLA
jgi:hypothetical protein